MPGPEPLHHAAIILAGGRGRRLGGVDKPGLRIGGRTLLDIALTAVAGGPVVVVGPDRPVPPGVVLAGEDPPGGGPAAGIAAGVAALPLLPDDALVAVFAADLPAIGPATVRHLVAAAGRTGAVLVDDQGRRQWLAGVWRYGALVGAVERRPDWHGRPVRELLDPLDPVTLPGHEPATADVDTPDDWRRAADSAHPACAADHADPAAADRRTPESSPPGSPR